MPTETQQHLLADGTMVDISRDGRHQYWIEGGPKMKGVTSLIGHIDRDSFGVGMNWALKMARENGGDLDAPRRSTKASMDTGTQLHESIDRYIKTGEIAEDPLFMAWYGEHQYRDWIGSELFVIEPELEFGGTVDALALNGQDKAVIHDWKTVEPGSWHKYGDTLRRHKDIAQLAAYTYALEGMDSLWVPAEGYITYVLRDGSEAVVVEADLKLGLRLFKASRELFLMTNG
jgi:hypothetical protein